MLIKIIFMQTTVFLSNAYENLSTDCIAAQSATWACPPNKPDCTDYAPTNAVDGESNTCMRADTIGKTSPKQKMWWYVDLGNIKSVHSIRIQFVNYSGYESRQRGRMAGFSLYLSNTTKVQDGYLCYKDGPELPSLDFNTTCVNFGRYVIYHNERLKDALYPTDYESIVITELCEVIVNGCQTNGFYGRNCHKRCPTNCQEHRCFITNGTCLGCKSGWDGTFCNQSCPFGIYGIECKNSCLGHCRGNISCNQTTGKCDEGCEAGWGGGHCDQACRDGMYGNNCLSKCSGNCFNNVSCDRMSGKCEKCKPGYMSELCNKTCIKGNYGQNCSYLCNPNCRNKECDNKDGVCTKGCDIGYQGKMCNTICNTGLYGLNCSEKCNDNCVNNSCDHVTGACRYGCIPGWKGSSCSQVCSRGYYGFNCSKPCSRHCRSDECDHLNGFCISGCANGYKKPKCIEHCDNTWYGINCSQRCSTNCVNKICHHVEGTCQYGCKPGWVGINCSEGCDKGLYGYNCTNTCSSFCKDMMNCSSVDGKCISGCFSGYSGPKCDKVCDEGRYGNNCSEHCNNNCVNQSCDHIHGDCTYGCKPGWIGSNCSKTCDAGFYGQNCSSNCSNCLENECDHLSGNCTSGCRNGFTGYTCDKPCKFGWFGQNCSERCSTSCNNQSCNIRNGNCTQGCKLGWRGSKCLRVCLYGSYGENCRKKCSGHCAANVTCDRLNGSCTNGCEKSFIGEMCDKRTVSESPFEAPGSDSSVLGGVLAVCVILVAVIPIAAIIIRRKRAIMHKFPTEREKFSSDLNSNEHLAHEDYEEVKMDGYDNPVLKAESMRKDDIVPLKNKTITVKDLQKRINLMSENGNAGFKEEYLKIPKGELHPCDEGKIAQNVPKNRYTTTFPYDHSRVVLHKSHPKESDYINANYIEDTEGNRAYIATQGPKPKTITDFWKMVWQENVSIVVCLTNLKEGRKTKCALYWPNANDKLQSGDLCVRHQDEKVYANHTVRKFRMKNTSDNSERDIIMLHYTQWPDHGVPEPLSLVIFHRQVMAISDIYHGKYTLVHCSAGIGRTGTYIALDALYRKAEKTGKINVQKYLEVMRKDRMNMIQGEDQYKIVYMALLESFRGKPRSMSTERFLKEFQEQSCYMNLGDVANKSPLSAEFEELLSLKTEYMDKDYEVGRKYKRANLTQNILPVDEYMCQMFNSEGERTYYNAVLLQSFIRADCLISAQYPLPDYTEDFLKLVRAFYTPIIVSLCPLREFPSFSLWFPSKNENKRVGEFTTKFKDCTKMQNLVKTNIVLQSKEGSDILLSILESTIWKSENDTTGRRILIDLITEARIEENTHPDARILVLSSDGAKRCGQFCVVYNALEQMTMDNEVDIFTITRLLQIRRTEFINNLEDYQFCYDAVADFLQNDTVYANC